jgi:hypothetical protein
MWSATCRTMPVSWQLSMLNYDNFAVTLGRAVETFRQGPDAVPEQKVALRTLAALTKLSGVTLEMIDGELYVDGHPVPVTLPGVRGLSVQLESHDVRSVRIARDAAPAGLLQLLRALAVPFGGFPRDEGPDTRLHDAGVTDIEVTLERPRRPSGPGSRVSGPAGRPAADDDDPTVKWAVADALQHAPRLSRPETAVANIVLAPAAADLPDRLAATAAGIHEELEHGRPSGAVRAVAQLLQLADAAPPGPAADALRGAVDALMTRSLLHGAVSCAQEETSQIAARQVLRAGGPAATDVVRERLLAADTSGERRRHLELLRQQPDGLRHLLLLLQHGDPGSVRRTADLVADERVLEAVPILIRISVHPDHAARHAILRALSALANADAVETLARLLERPGSEVRVDVARALQGPGVRALVPALERAAGGERRAEALGEFARALGRIGTPEAVGALARWAQPAGWRFWRRNPRRRRAAVDGLRAAGGAGAVAILRGLSHDADAEVRRGATEALEDLAIAARPRAP